MRPEKSKVDVYTIVIVGAGIAAMGLLIFIGVSLFRRLNIGLPQMNLGQKMNYGLQPDVLFLSSPVYAFSGKVSRVGAKNIVVTTDGIINSGGSDHQTLSSKLTFNVSVGEQTAISSSDQSASIGAPGQVGQTSPLKLNDIKVGQVVNVTSMTDLRITDPNKILASAINIEVVNTLRGQITSVKDNLIQVSGMVLKKPTTGEMPVDKIYNVNVNSSTTYEIQTVGVGSNRKIGQSDLSEGMMVIVTTDKEIGDATTVTAKTIQALILTKVPAPAILTPTPATVTNLPTR